MTYADIIKKSVLEGFSYVDISTTKIVITLLVAFLLAMYIFFVYRFTTQNEFYQRNFGVSMVIMAVITAGILLAMQSSLVVSLGMVGALSIVRFRTAIKDPLDLLFLFWSIGVGIITGAGLYNIAVITSIVATLGIIIFKAFPIKINSYLLSVCATNQLEDDELHLFMEENFKSFKLVSKNGNKQGKDYIYEVSLKKDNDVVVEKMLELRNIENVSLLENNAQLK